MRCAGRARVISHPRAGVGSTSRPCIRTLGGIGYRARCRSSGKTPQMDREHARRGGRGRFVPAARFPRRPDRRSTPAIGNRVGGRPTERTVITEIPVLDLQSVAAAVAHLLFARDGVPVLRAGPGRTRQTEGNNYYGASSRRAGRVSHTVAPAHARRLRPFLRGAGPFLRTSVSPITSFHHRGIDRRREERRARRASSVPMRAAVAGPQDLVVCDPR
jgi:hypothetical protein